MANANANGQWHPRPETVQFRWLRLVSRAFFLMSAPSLEGLVEEGTTAEVLDGTTVHINHPRVECWIRKILDLNVETGEATEYVNFAYRNFEDGSVSGWQILGPQGTMNELEKLWRSLFLPDEEPEPEAEALPATV
jgi:hypothetical protein